MSHKIFHMVQTSVGKRIQFGTTFHHEHSLVNITLKGGLHSRVVNKHIKLTGKAKRNPEIIYGGHTRQNK